MATLLAFTSSNGSNVVAVLDPAVPPGSPVGPRPLLNALLAAMVVLLVHGRIEEPAAVQKEREETEHALAQLTPEERAAAHAELARDPLYEVAPPGSVGLSRIAFGPFLALAMLEHLFLGPSVGEYARWLGLSG